MAQAPTSLCSGQAVAARLPVGGWQVAFWEDTEGRTVVDVASPCGTHVYRSASARRAALSIDAGWAGWCPGPDDEQQGWALAIGHAPAGLGHVVSFGRWAGGARLEGMTLTSEARSGLWVVNNGLWVAAATGYYTHVRLTARSTMRAQRLYLVSG
jgi:hypothetical protein